jgi:hypothetical protein
MEKREDYNRLSLNSTDSIRRDFSLWTGVFNTKSTRLFQGYAQELQAEINQELLETMHQTELEDWGPVR